jgi:hypothetical protein
MKRYLWLLIAVLLLLALFAAVQVSASPALQEGATTPPAAVLEFVAVAGNDNVKGADPIMLPITATIKVVTDTKVGPVPRTVVMGISGLNNVPINWPVRFMASSADPAAKVVTYTWSIVGKPADSKVAFPKDLNAAGAELTPDVPGAYMVSVALTYADKTQSEPAFQTFRAGTYVGTTTGNCKQCHPAKVDDWAKTGHARIFTELIDNKRTPDIPTHYAETCIVCHTNGWNLTSKGVPIGANGFTDVQAKDKWVFPTFAQIDAGGNWAKMPKDLQNMADIQCENCHGPAGEHVAGTGRPAVSMDEGVCNVCHNGSSRHNKGEQLKNAAHSDATAAAWNIPTGPGEQACVRCHSGAGYVTFLDDPKNPAAWDNSKQTVSCATCHDPHSNANPWQLRIVGKPVGLPFDAKAAGLSATCMECHNGRTNATGAVNSQFPHYSSVAEFLNDTGGVDYGKTIPNSPHGMMVGAAPIPNPAAAEDPEAAKFLFSAPGDTKGNVPGPCVTCHQWPIIADPQDPNYQKVGGHSFNTVSPDGKFDYTAACTGCHGVLKDFNFNAKADYDGNGKVEGVQDEVKGLLTVLWGALEKAGVKKVDTGYPYATLPKGKDGTVDDKIDNAWYNYRVVYGVMWGAEGPGNEGKAQSIHNFKRAVALLQQSYQDLTGKPVPNATIMQ